MFCLSISHKKANLNARSMLHCTKKQLPLLLENLKKRGNAFCVYLSTCNRVEIFAEGDINQAIDTISDFFDVCKENILEISKIYMCNDAIYHLFRLCSGLESMVIGEDEILGQIKDAYYFSLNNGYCNSSINKAFQAAIACAKYIKTNTLISKTSVSIASLAATKIKNVMPNGSVLVIGASGDTGTKVIKNLLTYGYSKIFYTLRKESNLDSDILNKCTAVDYSKRYDILRDVDIIVSATSSPHFTVSADKIYESEKPKLFIDLASPRDIDPRVEDISPFSLICLDDFRLEAENNQHLKIDSIKEAETIVELKTTDYLKSNIFSIYYDNILDYFEGDEAKAYAFRDNSSYTELLNWCEKFIKTK